MLDSRERGTACEPDEAGERCCPFDAFEGKRLASQAGRAYEPQQSQESEQARKSKTQKRGRGERRRENDYCDVERSFPQPAPARVGKRDRRGGRQQISHGGSERARDLKPPLTVVILDQQKSGITSSAATRYHGSRWFSRR